MLRCIIVDDEPLARERLKLLLGEAAVAVTVCGEAAGGKEAIALIHSQPPDLVFLDIQMPVLDGFDVVELLPAPRPYIVFVTAYDEYAIRAFEVHALDYLTKPVRLERLNRTLERIAVLRRANEQHKGLAALQQERAAKPLQRISIHVGRRLRILALDDIRRIESRDKLVFVHVAEGCYPTDFTLDTLETRLDPERFVRIHRSHIVNIDRIRDVQLSETGRHCVHLHEGTRLPIARRRLRDVVKLLGGAA